MKVRYRRLNSAQLQCLMDGVYWRKDKQNNRFLTGFVIIQTMKSPLKTTPNMTSVHIENVQLSESVIIREQQLDWFKRQLFGRKSEVK